MSDEENTPWHKKLLGGFKRTSERLTENLTGLVTKSKLDAETLDEIEEALIVSDLGPATAHRIRNRLADSRYERGIDEAGVREVLASEIRDVLAPVAKPLDIIAFPRPQVILVIGVNGSGKTTTIAKLAHLFLEQDYGVMLAAGDTFRAAAAEQLTTWAERSGAEIVRGAEGSDPSAVIFDGVERASARNIELVMADTAGRLHTKSNLMEELKKVRRVAEKGAGRVTETLLVIDATTGQNGLTQAKVFSEAVAVTGLIVTKMDGSAKGGIALAIEAELGIPIKFIGTGESIEDFAPFEPQLYIQSLLEA